MLNPLLDVFENILGQGPACQFYARKFWKYQPLELFLLSLDATVVYPLDLTQALACTCSIFSFFRAVLGLPLPARLSDDPVKSIFLRSFFRPPNVQPLSAKSVISCFAK